MAKKIVIDAGHGLPTAGKRTPDDIREWELNNKVALVVARLLADYEVEVHRVDDPTGKIDVDLYERVVRANKIMPDVLISIHHNAYTGKWGSHTGIETYYNLNRKKDSEKALAVELSVMMSTNTGLRNRGAKTAAFYMLTCDPKITAVLTEGGFMDSNIDHPIITKSKGQESYAKAIADALIKHLKLVKKTVQDKQSNNELVIGGKYQLVKNTPGYYTAADAKTGYNQRVSVLAGEYIIYNIANGMINITKTKGVPGSWINPGTTVSGTPLPPVASPTPPKVGDQYTLTKSTPGYYTSADAVTARNQRVTVLAGNYYVFNIANGMINVTKTKGLPGSWINPK